VPQIGKGGKFIFGKSLIREDLGVRIPPQAVSEYDIANEGRVYVFTGSKSTGGFCVTRRGLLRPSKLANILEDLPTLDDYSAPKGKFLPYKGRAYCWTGVSPEGIILLTPDMLAYLHLRVGMALLAIRSSNIAFTMGAKGPLLEKADNYDGVIEVY